MNQAEEELARIQKYMDGHLIAPAPRGLLQRIAGAIDGRDSVIRELEAECLRLQHAEAEAMALVMGQDGTIERLTRELEEVRGVSAATHGILSATVSSTAHPEKPDRFKALETHWHFPCGMCIHRDDSEPEGCKGCRFYFS